MLGVSAPDLVLFASFGKAADGMLSNWLKQEVAVALVDRADKDKACIKQSLETRQDIDAEIGVTADRLCVS